MTYYKYIPEKGLKQDLVLFIDEIEKCLYYQTMFRNQEVTNG